MSDDVVAGPVPARWRRKVVWLVVGALVATLFGGWLVARDVIASHACPTVDLLVLDENATPEQIEAGDVYRDPTVEEAVAEGFSEYCAQLFWGDEKR